MNAMKLTSCLTIQDTRYKTLYFSLTRIAETRRVSDFINKIILTRTNLILEYISLIGG